LFQLHCRRGFGEGFGLACGRARRIRVHGFRIHQRGGFEDRVGCGGGFRPDCWLWLRFKIHHRGGFDDRFDGGKGLRYNFWIWLRFEFRDRDGFNY
jgi:hypothetical protein